MSTGTDLMADLVAIAGAAGVRPGQPDDAVDGVQPRIVVEPATPEAVASVLARCTAETRTLVIRGGGTKMEWGRTPAAIDVLLSTRGLGTVQRYEPGDLTVTVEAGMTLTQLNAVLAAHGQYLPLDPRSDATTIGGVLATNESGPLRHRHGAPRDQVIGVRLATADGRLAAAGGHVVKNVAGYDLGKTVAGSFGSLAAIVSATFKLAPLPRSTATLTVDYADAGAVSAAATAVATSQFDPLAVEVDARISGRQRRASPMFQLSIRLGGTADVVAAHVAAVSAMPLIAGQQLVCRRDAEDRAGWQAYGARLWAAPGAVVKLSWMPAALERVLTLLARFVESGVDEVELQGRAAEGTGIVRLAGTAAAVAAAVGELRAQPSVLASVVIARADADVKARVDVWGMRAGAAKLGGAVKRALDPAGVLNAGRGPV